MALRSRRSGGGFKPPHAALAEDLVNMSGGGAWCCLASGAVASQERCKKVGRRFRSLTCCDSMRWRRNRLAPRRFRCELSNSVAAVGSGGSCSDRRRSASSRSPAGVMVNPRHPVEARSSTAHTSLRQQCSPGSRPITLTRRRVSPKAAIDEVRVPHPGPVLTREPQVHRQRVAVVEQAPHRGRIGVAPTLVERVDPLLGYPTASGPGSIVLGHVEDRPVVGLDLRLGVLGHLGQHVSGDDAPGNAAAARRPWCARAAPISPAAPSLITSSGQRSPRSPSPVRKPSQASPDSLAPASSPTNTGLPSVSMPHAASTGSADAFAWYLKCEPSRNR